MESKKEKNGKRNMTKERKMKKSVKDGKREKDNTHF